VKVWHGSVRPSRLRGEDIVHKCDFAKTGVLYPVPRNIASYGRPLPYFMKYIGKYYAKLNCLSKSKSNMNRMCMALERWERGVRFRRLPTEFNWRIMYDAEIGYDQKVFDEVEKLYLQYNDERNDHLLFERQCRNYDRYKEEIGHLIDKKTASHYETNWQAFHNVYRNKCALVCPDIRELANIVTVLCYEKYPKKNRKFMWHMAGPGIVANIKSVPVRLPQRDPNGEYEYLGQTYSLADPQIVGS